MQLRFKIEQLLEEDINPAIAIHDGRCNLVDVYDWSDTGVIMIVVEYEGSCTACSSASSTLAFITNFIKEDLAETEGFKGAVDVLTIEQYKEMVEELEAVDFLTTVKEA
jgi:Fe-S cluster biogenesis protein NfuA